ncbi:MAG: hypothetical protein HKN25_16025 [Pyrinomonadaceae bacterium]|nr:hypothetical protein [Pyrinomonadaceae bacterium]
MEELNLLQNYEIKSWDLTPRFYKIIGASAVINVLFFGVLANTSLLNSRACDSPFVSKVCQVLDTVYVGARLYSGDKDYVVKDYTKTEIDDAEVVWIDQTGVGPQFAYPEGYFQVANPEDQLQDDLAFPPDSTFDTVPSTPNPVFTNPTPPASNSGGGLLARAPRLPKRNRRPVTGKLPDNPFGIVDEKDKKDDKLKNDSPSKLPELDEKTAKNDKDKKDKKDDETKKPEKNPLEENTAVKSDPVKEVEINKKPLEDFAADIVDKWSKKEVDLNNQFRVRLKAKLTENGRLAKGSVFDPASDQGDQKMINVAKSALEAVGDSGWLAYLSDLGVKDVTITLMQNEENLVARIESIAKTENEAKTLASGINGLISLAKLKKLGEDETQLLKAAKAPKARGKVFFLDFQMPKPEAQEMMNRKLTEALAKKQKEQKGEKIEAKPSGTADLAGKDKKSAK